MLKAISNLILYRLIGGRIMLAVALIGLARRLIGGIVQCPCCGSRSG